MIKHLRRMWQIRTGRVETPFDGGVPFWMISLIAHLVLILLVATWIVPGIDRSLVSFSASTEPLELIEDVAPDVEFEDMMTEVSGEISETDVSLEAAEEAMSSVDIENDSSQPDLDLDFSDVGTFETGLDGLDGGAEAFAEIATKGEAGTAVAGASGAVDRISEEIIQSLEDNKTLVVWLFDQSGSLLEQRTQIMKRLDKVYNNDLAATGLLGDLDQAQLQNQRLLTDVIAFGNKITPMLKKPTAHYDQASEAIGEIELDSSGVERVMAAVTQAANKYKWMHKIDSETKKRKRNVRFIIVSDEAGDDGDQTDTAVKICRENQIPVYVIGVPAPFGRQKTDVKWVDPDPNFDQTPQVARVNQGPESLMPERLQLDLTGSVRDLELIDSGFGPFNLTRLCFETGGIYFAVHPNRRSGKRGVRWKEVSNYSAYLRHFFDSDTMKAYRPDYVSRGAYQNALKQSALRSALVRAATFTNTGTLTRPRLDFPNYDEADFVNLVSRAQRDAAIIEPKLNQLFEILKVGESTRDQESSLRWQAGYDLAIGQALAAKLRAETYNMMLAAVKTNMKFEPPKGKNKQNNTWLLEPADTVTTGSRSEKLAAKAKTYLQRVVEKHPRTPWALIAQRELAIPIGWKWQQTYTTPPDERDKEAAPKKPKNMNDQPKRQPPKL